MRFSGLVENEMLKIAKQRRFRVVVLILVALIGLIAYGSSRARERFLRKDWHIAAQERMAWLQGRIRDSRTPPSALRWAQFELARLQYHVDRDMAPEAIAGAIFARSFANAASYLLLPLLAIVFASDIVSAEFAQGGQLLRRVGLAGASPRVKLVALMLAITLTVLLARSGRVSLPAESSTVRRVGRAHADGFRASADLRSVDDPVGRSGRTRGLPTGSRGSPRCASARSRS
jgi:ABC-2 type transport system permease protein